MYSVQYVRRSAYRASTRDRNADILFGARVLMASDSLTTISGMVQALGHGCPWTKAQRCEDMMFWMRKELIEVEEVLRAADGAGGNPVKPVDGNELIKELGDVLFDALMMIQCAKAQFPGSGVSVEACAASACVKIKRRCPYIFDKEHEGATTVADAERAWQAAKQKERVAAEGDVSAATTAPAAPAWLEVLVTAAKPAAPETCGTDSQHSSNIQAIRDAPDNMDGDSDDGGLGAWEADYVVNEGPIGLGELTSSGDETEPDEAPKKAKKKVTPAPKKAPVAANGLPVPPPNPAPFGDEIISLAPSGIEIGDLEALGEQPSSLSARAKDSPPAARSPGSTPPPGRSLRPTAAFKTSANPEETAFETSAYAAYLSDEDDGGLLEWERDLRRGIAVGEQSEESDDEQ